MSKGLKVPSNPAMALRALNAQHAAAQADDHETNNTTILQTNKPTDIQTNKHTDNPTDIQTILQTNNQTDSQTNQNTDQPTHKHAVTTPGSMSVNASSKPTRRPAAKRTSRKEAVAITAPQPIAVAPDPPTRIDGRTLRIRQETSDRTMVTSMRLSVTTLEQLDEFCWKHRQRKQDVVQDALTLYFQTTAEQKQQ